MEAPVEGDVVEWQEGMEATGPVPLQALEVSEVLSRMIPHSFK